MKAYTKTNYEQPEVSIVRFELEETVTTSGFILIDEGFGDEIIW